MPRPPAASNDALVDADACARAASTIERRFPVAELSRVMAAGALLDQTAGGASIDARLKFSSLDARPVIDGTLAGTVSMTCQRCMQALPVAIEDEFKVVVVPEECVDEPSGYEPVVADAARFDVRWLIEDQVLLALPLVPMHEPGQCAPADAPAEADEEREGTRQKPFENLRDMLRQR
jgi:uncharacterized protein